VSTCDDLSRFTVWRRLRDRTGLDPKSGFVGGWR
jgi:hypothetical protein